MKFTLSIKCYFVFAFCLIFLIAYNQVSAYENKYLKEFKSLPIKEALYGIEGSHFRRADIFERYIVGGKYNIEAELKDIDSRHGFVTRNWETVFYSKSYTRIQCRYSDMDGLQDVKLGEFVFLTGTIENINSYGLELKDCSFEKV